MVRARSTNWALVAGTPLSKVQAVLEAHPNISAEQHRWATMGICSRPKPKADQRAPAAAHRAWRASPRMRPVHCDAEAQLKQGRLIDQPFRHQLFGEFDMAQFEHFHSGRTFICWYARAMMRESWGGACSNSSKLTNRNRGCRFQAATPVCAPSVPAVRRNRCRCRMREGRGGPIKDRRPCPRSDSGSRRDCGCGFFHDLAKSAGSRLAVAGVGISAHMNVNDGMPAACASRTEAAISTGVTGTFDSCARSPPIRSLRR